MKKKLTKTTAITIIATTAVTVVAFGAAILLDRARVKGPYDEVVFNRVAKYCDYDTDNVTRGKDKWHVEVTPYFSSSPEAEYLTLYEFDMARAQCEGEKIIFAYDNDRAFVTAESSDVSISNEFRNVPSNYMKKYAAEDKKNVSQKGGVLAWTYEDKARMIIDYKKGEYELDSIWCVNDSEKTISLVWYDETSTSWKEYASSK